MNLVISAFSLPQTFGYGMPQPQPQPQVPAFSGGFDSGLAPFYANQVSLGAPEEEYELEAAILGALLGNFGQAPAYQPGPQDWYRMALAGLGASMPVLGMMTCCVLVMVPGAGGDPQDADVSSNGSDMPSGGTTVQTGGSEGRAGGDIVGAGGGTPGSTTQSGVDETPEPPSDGEETPEPPSVDQSEQRIPGGGIFPFPLGSAQKLKKAAKSSDKAKDPSDLAAKIDHFLEEQNSPAAGSGYLFVESGKKHQVDPLLLLAIAGHETVFGTEGVGLDGMLGVGAYDDNPNNATEDPKFAGVANQLEVGAQTFEHWRNFYGSDSNDSIEHQTEVVGQKWATDPEWAAGVMRHYAEIKAEIG